MNGAKFQITRTSDNNYADNKSNFSKKNYQSFAKKTLANALHEVLRQLYYLRILHPFQAAILYCCTAKYYKIHKCKLPYYTCPTTYEDINFSQFQNALCVCGVFKHFLIVSKKKYVSCNSVVTYLYFQWGAILDLLNELRRNI